MIILSSTWEHVECVNIAFLLDFTDMFPVVVSLGDGPTAAFVGILEIETRLKNKLQELHVLLKILINISNKK